ncbi:MAG: hypothetical protein P1U32_02440 [Legionellaceae bacterium]|nr:hypothetical protein [Legionellaceae bacterium]
MRKGFFQQQALRVLEQEKYALLLAMVLSAVPYMDWLALALMALVTLRQGPKAGLRLLLPVMLTHILVAAFSVPLSTAIMMTVVSSLSCYAAAYILKTTTSWHVVSGVLFVFVAVGVVVLQAFSPEFIIQQYMHLEATMENMGLSQMNGLEFWGHKGVSLDVIANYLLGIQAASLAFSAVVPLLFARSLQAQLFYPEGFRSEMLNFRGDRTAFALLVLLTALAYLGHTVAMNCLPVVLLYFVLAGLSFGAYMFSNMRPFALMLLLIMPLIFLSWAFLPLYVLLGALDSLFNFRLYLSNKTGQAA